ncbi:MAG TPA: hypothetical protein VFM18_14635 [Methanosarcina sp.]|nr:hypothetical protein [Methanosarcina sp.]
MATDYKKELRSFFDKLMQVETGYQGSYLDPNPYTYYNEIMDSFDASDLMAQGLKGISNNPSLAEAFVLDALFRMEALERDSNLRAKTRLSYLDDAYFEGGSEMQRLELSKFNSLQFALGNSEVQKKSEA